MGAHLDAIDERTTAKMPSDHSHAPSSDGEDDAMAAAHMPSDQHDLRRQRKRMAREGRVDERCRRSDVGASSSVIKSVPKERSPKERLPNPFGQQLSASASRRAEREPLGVPIDASVCAGASAGEGGGRGHRRTGSDGLPVSFLPIHAHAMSGSGDESSDSSTGGGLATVYSPSQARNELRPEALKKMRDRFVEAMRASYGARELEELFEHCDIMLIPPNFTVVTSPHQEVRHHPFQPVPAAENTFLYVLDRGNVSSYATLGGDHNEQDAAAPTDVTTNIPRGQESNPRHRLAKYGPGAILGVASFVTPVDMPDLNIMPTAAISDTYCQLLRLPRSRCDELETTRPKLIFRLYRLLVLISERRLQVGHLATSPSFDDLLPTPRHISFLRRPSPHTSPNLPSSMTSSLTFSSGTAPRAYRTIACASSPPKLSRSTCARRPTSSGCLLADRRPSHHQQTTCRSRQPRTIAPTPAPTPTPASTATPAALTRAPT